MLREKNLKYYWEIFVKRICGVKIHIFILLITTLYLLMAPKIYAYLFLTYGKPVFLEETLPFPSEEILFAVDGDGSIIINNQNIYQTNGWAFLMNVPDQSIYDRYLVLKSGSRQYFFSLEDAKRHELSEAFKNQGGGLSNAGFQAYLSGDSISSGAYNIGFFFKEKGGTQIYYSVSERYLIRTPNHINIMMGEKPSLSTPGQMDITAGVSLQDGLPIRYTQPLPKPLSNSTQNIDAINQTSFNGAGFYVLRGWGFLEGEKDQSKYERLIVLKSEKDIFFFPTSKSFRLDVQKAFSHHHEDLQFSGFETYIRKDALPTGIYEIGILYRNVDSESIKFVKTNKSFFKSSEKFLLISN